MTQHASYRSKEAAAVYQKAADAALFKLLHIFAVKGGLDRYLQLVAAIDLRPAGQPRKYVVGSVLVALRNQVILIPEGRPRPDNAHISQQDIDNLRQLVQRGLS